MKTVPKAPMVVKSKQGEMAAVLPGEAEKEERTLLRLMMKIPMRISFIWKKRR